MNFARTIKILAVFGLLFVGSPFAFAQTGGSGHFVQLAQGLVPNLANSGAYPSSATWVYRYGQGLSGTTTGAFVASQFNKIRSEESSMITLDVVGYSDPGYSSSVHTCSFDVGTGTGNYTDPFFQLYLHSGGCVFDAADYVQVTVTIIGANGGASGNYTDTAYTNYRGTSATTTALYSNSFTSAPDTSIKAVYFSVVSDGFRITPTASSTGLYLSGAQEFCNAQFGSSTSIGSYVGQGICIGVGYLFVPTPESVQQFGGIPSALGATPPLSWFGQIQDILKGASASSTANFPSVTINFGTSTQILGFTTLNVISTTTMSKYLSESTRSSILYLEGAVFFLSVVSLFYVQIRGVWKSA